VRLIVESKSTPVQIWTFPESSSALRVFDISRKSAHEVGGILL
jgi:hypothetical protein